MCRDIADHLEFVQPYNNLLQDISDDDVLSIRFLDPPSFLQAKLLLFLGRPEDRLDNVTPTGSEVDTGFQSVIQPVPRSLPETR